MIFDYRNNILLMSRKTSDCEKVLLCAKTGFQPPPHSRNSRLQGSDMALELWNLPSCLSVYDGELMDPSSLANSRIVSPESSRIPGLVAPLTHILKILYENMGIPDCYML